MSRVYVGSIDPRTTERDLEDEFRVFGALRSVWVARKPPGYAFVEFDDKRDAVDSIKALDGKNGWRVEMARTPGGRGRNGEEKRCYECNEPGHFARECRLRVGPSGLGPGRRGRSRSRSPRYRRSPSYRQRSASPRRRHSRTPPKRRQSYSRSRSRDGSHSRSRSRSPTASPKRERAVSPLTNGASKDQRQSRSPKDQRQSRSPKDQRQSRSRSRSRS